MSKKLSQIADGSAFVASTDQLVAVRNGTTDVLVDAFMPWLAGTSTNIYYAGRVGIGGDPSAELDIHFADRAAVAVQIKNTTSNGGVKLLLDRDSGGYSFISFRNGGNDRFGIGSNVYNADDTFLDIGNETVSIMRFSRTTKHVLIGLTADDGTNMLQVGGPISIEPASGSASLLLNKATSSTLSRLQWLTAGTSKWVMGNGIFTTDDTNLDIGTDGSSIIRLSASALTVTIGSQTAVATAKLAVVSTTQGFLPPVMTTTQKNAISTPAEGLIVYDSTLHKLSVRTASTWETVTSV